MMPLLAALLWDVAPYTLSPPATAGSFDAAPVLQWKHPLPAAAPSSSVHSETSGPVLAGARIYVGAAGEDALLVLDRRDGRRLLRLPSHAPVRAAPIVLEDRVIFSDAGGATWCYPLKGGDPLWTHQGSAPVLASPTLDGDRLFVSNLANVVVAIDVRNGELLWRHAQRLDAGRSAELSLYAAPSPTVAGDLVYVGFADGTVAALRADTGELTWQRRVGEGQYPDIVAPVLIRGKDAVLAGFSSPILGVNLTNSSVRWRLDQGLAAGAIDGGGQGDVPNGEFGPEAERYLYLPGVDGVLRCVDGQTGVVRWEWDSKTDSALVRPVPTPAGLLVASTGGGLSLINPVNGHARWTWEPGYTVAGISAPPAVEGRQMVLVTNSGDIASFIVPRPEPAGVDRARPDTWAGPVTR